MPEEKRNQLGIGRGVPNTLGQFTKTSDITRIAAGANALVPGSGAIASAAFNLLG